MIAQGQTLPPLDIEVLRSAAAEVKDQLQRDAAWQYRHFYGAV
jgi:hypothetical protein